jgi:hypothetical protein
MMPKTNRLTDATRQPNPTVPAEEIAQRAYQYWEERGRQDGYDLDDWLKAEEDLSRSSAFSQSAK